ncbi:hypothetical protein [Rhizobium skierniewicense]|uniref:hypothetical protein n=1 Tax=Rhizobium skierniewicense TaxID=984260 RepID=UPI001573BD42|nr:hypothetical protein [Rhizobium skierniewicense]NTF32791.1 hypothetical protein [Rhizobium skierniewicense]
MESYSFWADLLHTFRMMSDQVKILLIYMPCVFALGFAALYLYHLRKLNPPVWKEPQPYTLLPPDRTPPNERVQPSLERLRRLDDRMAEMKGERDIDRL